MARIKKVLSKLLDVCQPESLLKYRSHFVLIFVLKLHQKFELRKK